ncbi:MAG: hypothetical protein J6577_04375 [Gilliamella sp.]|nr:hypothetical protein [Gilliamella sp.]
MNGFLMVFYNPPYWGFIVLGGILLVIKLLNTGKYGFWSGIATFIFVLIAWILPFSWPILWIMDSIGGINEIIRNTK